MVRQSHNTLGQSKIIQYGLAIAIAVVFTFSASSLAGLIKTEPKYDAFCKPEVTNKAIQDEASCIANNGRWNGYTEPFPVIETTRPVGGYCDTTFQCNTDFQAAQKTFGEAAFIIYILFGLIAIIGGIRFGKSFPVTTGLILGGVITTIVGAAKYFEYTPPAIRTVLLILVCGTLIWIGASKFQHTETNS